MKRALALAGLLVVILFSTMARAEDSGASSVAFTDHALNVADEPARLQSLAGKTSLQILQNGVSSIDASQFAILAHGLTSAPAGNQPLIMQILGLMLAEDGRRAGAGLIDDATREIVVMGAEDLLGHDRAEIRAASLRLLQRSGSETAIAPALDLLSGDQNEHVRLEAALLVHAHADGPYRDVIMAAVSRISDEPDAQVRAALDLIVERAGE